MGGIHRWQDDRRSRPSRWTDDLVVRHSDGEIELLAANGAEILASHRPKTDAAHAGTRDRAFAQWFDALFGAGGCAAWTHGGDGFTILRDSALVTATLVNGAWAFDEVRLSLAESMAVGEKNAPELAGGTPLEPACAIDRDGRLRLLGGDRQLVFRTDGVIEVVPRTAPAKALHRSDPALDRGIFSRSGSASITIRRRDVDRDEPVFGCPRTPATKSCSHARPPGAWSRPTVTRAWPMFCVSTCSGARRLRDRRA